MKKANDSCLTCWKNVSDELPKEGRYVLVHLTKDNWSDSQDMEGVYFKVAKFIRGLSISDREKMKNGEIPDPVYSYIGGESNRSSVICSEDEYGNNLRPFIWKPFGPDLFFGQEVDYWMEIPRSFTESEQE